MNYYSLTLKDTSWRKSFRHDFVRNHVCMCFIDACFVKKGDSFLFTNSLIYIGIGKYFGLFSFYLEKTC